MKIKKSQISTAGKSSGKTQVNRGSNVSKPRPGGGSTGDSTTISSEARAASPGSGKLPNLKSWGIAIGGGGGSSSGCGAGGIVPGSGGISGGIAGGQTPGGSGIGVGEKPPKKPGVRFPAFGPDSPGCQIKDPGFSPACRPVPQERIDWLMESSGSAG